MSTAVSTTATIPTRRTLTVLQASPLAYEDWTGKEQACQSLDLDAERILLKEALQDTNIDVKFTAATANHLSEVLSQGRDAWLHFSCHGHPKYLFLETDYGGAQMLLVDETLQKWIRSASGQDHGDGRLPLQLVVCSACHSRTAGEAFLKAGVPHVVCCEQNENTLSNTAAMIFARDLYRALAHGRTLKQSFDLAVHAVIQSPDVRQAGLDPNHEASKFALLPEGEGANHDLRLSLETPHDEVLPPPASECTTAPSLLPIPPPHFLGRELEMFRVMSALFVKKKRLVRITGPDGIGKVSLAKAIGHYMEQRNMWGDKNSMYWLPSTRRGKDGDILSWWSRLMELIENPRLYPNKLLTDKSYQTVRQELCDQLYDKKAVVIYDVLKFPEKQRQKLGLWLDDLVEQTRFVKVIVIHGLGKNIASRHATGYVGGDMELMLEPLNFASTVTLFGCVCPHATPRSWSRKNIFEKHSETTVRVLGEGIPAKTMIAADNMTKLEYETLVKQHDRPICASDFQASLSIQQSVSTPNNRTASYTESTWDDLGEDNGNDEDEKELRPPLRSQMDLQNHFMQLLKKEGKIHRKNVTSFIRRGVKGERITTVIDGIQESENTVKDDKSWVVCGKAAGEYYVLTNQQFQECYEESRGQPIQYNNSNPLASRLRQQGFAEYPSKRQVWARKVTEEDMTYLRHGNTTAREAYFMAPWGESMRVEQGDYLVMQYPGGNDEIYRVECAVFKCSYASDKEDKPISWLITAPAIAFASLVVMVSMAVLRSKSAR